MMLRIRFHGRGGEGAKTASRIVGTAAFNEGFHAQDSPIYGAERRGAPVTALTRISDQEILERGYVFDPDLIVVMDDTLLHSETVRPLDGVRERGVIFVNTSKHPDEVRLERDDLKPVTLDLTSYAIEIIGKPILSAAAGAVAARITSLISENTLVRAVEEELREVGLEGELLKKNGEVALRAYRNTAPQEISTGEHAVERRLAPFEEIVGRSASEDIVSMGNSQLRKTGDWRILKPIIDYAKCTDCMICYDYCPESAITLGVDGRPLINYDICKGCDICYRECPPKAIAIEREVRA